MNDQFTSLLIFLWGYLFFSFIDFLYINSECESFVRLVLQMPSPTFWLSWHSINGLFWWPDDLIFFQCHIIYWSYDILLVHFGSCSQNLYHQLWIHELHEFLWASLFFYFIFWSWFSIWHMIYLYFRVKKVYCFVVHILPYNSSGISFPQIDV